MSKRFFYAREIVFEKAGLVNSDSAIHGSERHLKMKALFVLSAGTLKSHLRAEGEGGGAEEHDNEAATQHITEFRKQNALCRIKREILPYQRVSSH